MVKAAGVGIVAAVVGVVIMFLIADALSGPLLVTPVGADSPEETTVVLAAVFTVVGGIVGLGIAALCKRFLGNPPAAFLGICAVGLTLYAIMPFVAAEEVATAIWLNVMHLVAAAPIMGSLVTELRGPGPLDI
jgi:hypothetical protein